MLVGKEDDKLCSILQRYKMKGNHNKIDYTNILGELCSILQRYNPEMSGERKSQHA